MKKIIREQLRCVFLVCLFFCVLILCREYSYLFADKDGITIYYSTINTYPEPVSLYMKGLLAEEENRQSRESKSEPELDLCSGRYIYIHDLPSKFNDDILKYWSTINQWFLMSNTLNTGFGTPVNDFEGVLQEKSWYSTSQFSLEIIFHNRMKNYKCLTTDSSLASAIYVPFYAGLEMCRYQSNSNITMRDAVGIDLVKWLVQRREWQVMSGRDHFFVAGRITWDFRRDPTKESAWGTNLMTLPEAMNMTIIAIESCPWGKSEYAIPYPTHFHPSSESEIFDWQNKVRGIKRQYLYSFVGAPRPLDQNSIRNKIIEQCIASKKKCKLLNCNSKSVDCNNPIHVMKMLERSIFCLQPSGDSFTRRSTFDAILAGCIPVFFHPETAYNQYVWHLPKNNTKYSVFISEDDLRNGKANIERILLQKLKRVNEVLAMREEVIRLIPKITYSSPRSKLETIEDAFDIAIKKVLDRVVKIRKRNQEGKSAFDLSDNHRNLTIPELN